VIRDRRFVTGDCCGLVRDPCSAIREGRLTAETPPPVVFGRPARLEAQPNLELNHAPGETRERVTKVIGIGEVGVALATGLERRQIQHVEDVEKIGAEV